MKESRIARSNRCWGALAATIALVVAPDRGQSQDGGAKIPFLVASRVSRRADTGPESQRLPALTMSEGWGCASFESERGRIHQCWDAGPAPRAWTVPFMKDRIYVARDRWCEHDIGALTFRCWQRPRRGDTRPREMPPSWQWLNPNGAGWEDIYNRGDRLADVIMGGTFACLRTTQAQGVFCLGDDRYGQLGSSTPPRPEAGAGDAAFVRDIGREVTPALGTWHACALAEPPGMWGDIPVVCWGRGDHGQLGAPAPDTCTVDGNTVACARTPVRGVLVKDQMAVLGVGDLFTCVTSEDGTKCWGASRDGLFGGRGSCPRSLRRAWPTPDGPVSAPNASCTTKPVSLPGATEFDPDLNVAPREICYQSAGARRCLSGVPRPSDPKLTHSFSSPGSDASACAVRGQDIFCWGEKYSPSRAPGRLVRVAFEPLPPLGDQAVIDGMPLDAAKAQCQIRRACQNPVQPIPPCEVDRDPGRTVAEILSNTKSLSGAVVRVHGALGLGALHSLQEITGGFCDRSVSCCNRLETPALLGGADGALTIDGLGCLGDESRVCCNTPAYGQSVVATGILTPERPHRVTVGWQLVKASLCEVRRGQ